MPPATARCSAAHRVASLALMRMPPVTPAPSVISEISSPVRPKKLFLMGGSFLAPANPDAGGPERSSSYSSPSSPRYYAVDSRVPQHWVDDGAHVTLCHAPPFRTADRRAFCWAAPEFMAANSPK